MAKQAKARKGKGAVVAAAADDSKRVLSNEKVQSTAQIISDGIHAAETAGLSATAALGSSIAKELRGINALPSKEIDAIADRVVTLRGWNKMAAQTVRNRKRDVRILIRARDTVEAAAEKLKAATGRGNLNDVVTVLSMTLRKKNPLTIAAAVKTQAEKLSASRSGGKVKLTVAQRRNKARSYLSWVINNLPASDPLVTAAESALKAAGYEIEAA